MVLWKLDCELLPLLSRNYDNFEFHKVYKAIYDFAMKIVHALFGYVKGGFIPLRRILKRGAPRRPPYMKRYIP